MSKLSKVIVCIVLVIALTLSMTACGDPTPTPTPTPTTPTPATPTPATPTPATPTPKPTGGGGYVPTFPDGWDKPTQPTNIVTVDGIGGLTGNGTYTLDVGGTDAKIENEAFTGKLTVKGTFDTLEIIMPNATVEILSEIGTLNATTGKNTLILGATAKITTALTVNGGNVQATKGATVETMTIATGNTTTQTVEIKEAKVTALDIKVAIELTMEKATVGTVDVSAPSKITVKEPVVTDEAKLTINNKTAEVSGTKTEIAIEGSANNIAVTNGTSAELVIDVSKQTGTDKLAVTNNGAKLEVVTDGTVGDQIDQTGSTTDIPDVISPSMGAVELVTENFGVAENHVATGFEIKFPTEKDYTSIAKIEVELYAGTRLVAKNTMTQAGFALIFGTVKESNEYSFSSPFYPTVVIDEYWNFGSTLIKRDDKITSTKLIVTDKAGVKKTAENTTYDQTVAYDSIFSSMSIPTDYISITHNTFVDTLTLNGNTYSRIGASFSFKTPLDKNVIQSITATLEFENGKKLTHVAKLSEWTGTALSAPDAYFFGTDGLGGEVKADRTWWSSAEKIDPTFGKPKNITLTVTDKLGNVAAKTSGNISATELAKYDTLFDEVTVKNADELQKALANSEFTTINIDGTIGTTGDNAVYTVNRPLTIKGISGNKVYGSFVVTSKGVTIDGLDVSNLGGNAPNKNAIYLLGNSITVINNTFNLGSTDKLGNGILVLPHGNDAVALNIKDNTFKGYKNEVGGWASSAIVIAENLVIKNYILNYEGTDGEKSSEIVIPNEKDIMTGNTYVDCANLYEHTYWTENVPATKTAYVGSGARLIELIEDEATPDSIFVLANDITFTETYTPATVLPCTLDGNGHTISGMENSNQWYGFAEKTSGNAVIKNLKITPASNAKEGLIPFIAYAYGVSFTFDNVEILEGNISTTVNDNNESAFMCHSFADTTTFKNCTNNLDFSTSHAGLYTSAFLGGYVGSTKEAPKKLIFENCTNNGDIIAPYASLFVGNGNTMQFVTITMTNCVNDGKIEGSLGAQVIGAVSHTSIKEEYQNKTATELGITGTGSITKLQPLEKVTVTVAEDGKLVINKADGVVEGIETFNLAFIGYAKADAGTVMLNVNFDINNANGAINTNHGKYSMMDRTTAETAEIELTETWTTPNGLYGIKYQIVGDVIVFDFAESLYADYTINTKASITLSAINASGTVLGSLNVANS